jgi:hypothetical protein
MHQRLCAAALSSVLMLLAESPGIAQTPDGAPGMEEAELDPSGTVEAPGYEDFKERDLSPREIEELEERRDDRNVVSPGMRDDRELDWEMERDGN